MAILKITECPTCGSKRIKRVRRRVWKDSFRGQEYTVPNLVYHECPDCGERLYGPEAMEKIERYSPAYAHRRSPALKRPARTRRQSV